MPTIRQLPVSLVNKIAAGEVIERPASVVKELLENSIDAGATRIELTVEGGGMELIRISDNGCGIEPDQLLLSIAPHATSKLVEADDLFDIRTLGFRGEALASIAEVSHLNIRSRVPTSESGAELFVRGGAFEEPRACASPIGTTMEVRHLFFNTPVRRKFLKSNQTEMGHVLEAFTRIALAHPSVHMVLISNGRTLYDLAASERWSERIEAFFGEEVADALIAIDSRDSQIRLHGFVVEPSVSRGNNRMQYLFLNGRFIRDRALQHALSEAYRGLLMVGRFPLCFLHLEMPPNLVDVNVHPTKSEVRFVDGGEVYRRLLQTLRAKFLSTNLTARVTMDAAMDHGLTSPDLAPNPPTHPSSTWSQAAANAADSEDERQGRLLSRDRENPLAVEFLNRPAVPAFRPFPQPTSHFPTGSSLPAFPSSNQQPPSTAGLAPFPVSPCDSAVPSQALPDTAGCVAIDDDLAHRQDASHPPPAPHLGFQVLNRYLVTQDEEGMIVIDQHALHERILYEQIRDRVLSQSMESQRMLIPETVTLTGPERAAALDAREALKQIGIEVEPFGGDTLLITAYPAILSQTAPAEMLRQVLEPLVQAGKRPEARDLLDSMMHMMSCKAAIKAGDRLSPEEISSLLAKREHFADTHHCPHGRPTALFFSRDQLDKMFKRT